ncbi:MAG TPA: hypothetical protein VNF06_00860, partial [Candidatus Aquilonibacter sp.]|nr:hypothetical protein [Candidatus Aquilonibacter sp.]
RGRQIDVNHVYFFGSKSPDATDEQKKSYREHEKIFASALYLGKIAEVMGKRADFEGAYYGESIAKMGLEDKISPSTQSDLYRDARKLLSHLLKEGGTNLDSTINELVRAAKYCDLGGDEEAAEAWIEIAIKRANGILDDEEKIAAKTGKRT